MNALDFMLLCISAGFALLATVLGLIAWRAGDGAFRQDLLKEAGAMRKQCDDLRDEVDRAREGRGLIAGRLTVIEGALIAAQHDLAETRQQQAATQRELSETRQELQEVYTFIEAQTEDVQRTFATHMRAARRKRRIAPWPALLATPTPQLPEQLTGRQGVELAAALLSCCPTEGDLRRLAQTLDLRDSVMRDGSLLDKAGALVDEAGRRSQIGALIVAAQASAPGNLLLAHWLYSLPHAGE